MDYHYKAFISYRHAELDTKVAVEIQNRIERYVIPGSIRKELGIKSIGRVFRDKDELPSTSDLNDNIKNAILNSEYLICICSPRYIESIWCRKEIEFFLESHDKHHVLTVLAEGDPYEVVPDILCKETVTVQDENGNDVTIETRLEPLSCDYRVDWHRARAEEFPRLAAVLIGCRYADLRQKMRKRRMRITAAAAAFATALAAYFVWSYINIQINYRQSLINQSEYLASSAREALSVNDNVKAAQLSLAALPDQGRDRPIVPEAVYTLSQAIGAYQTKQTMNLRGVATYTTRTGMLDNYTITKDAHYMAMISTSGDVEVCDLCQNTTPYTLSSYNLFGTAANAVTSCGNDRFVLYGLNLDDMAVVRFSDGEVLWHQKFQGSGKRVLALGNNSSLLMLFTRQEVIILDSQNGDVVSRCSIQEASGGEATQSYKPAYAYESINRCVSVNEENASCTVLCSIDDDSFSEPATGVLTYYYETGKTVWTPFRQDNYQFESISQDADGNILFAYAEKDTDYCLNGYFKLAYDSGTALFQNGKASLLMVKEGSGEIVWQNTVEYIGLRDSTYSCFEIRTVPGDGEFPARKVVLAAVSNKIVLFDAADGSKIKEIPLSDWVVSVDRQRAFEPYIRVNGASGAQYYMDIHSEDYDGMSFMEGPVDNTGFYHARDSYEGVSQFVVEQDNIIRVFKAEQGDNDFTLFGFAAPEGTISNQFILGSRLVLINSDGKLYIYDMESEKMMHEIQLDSGYSYFCLSASSDLSTLYLTSSEDYSGEKVLRVDLENGTCEAFTITQVDFLTGAGRWRFGCAGSIASGDYIFYRASNFNSMTSYWFRYSVKDGSTAMLELPYYEDLQKSDSALSKCLFSQDGSKGVLYFDNALYLADFENNTVNAMDAKIPGVTYGTRRESDGMFAYYYQGSQESDNRKELRVYDASGNTIWAIDNFAEKITALQFYKDILVVGTENKRVFAYDARTGEQKGVVDLNKQLYHASLHIYDSGSGDLIIDTGANSVFMVDYEAWALTGAVYETVGYCPALKRIISSTGTTENKYGYCRYYSVQDLVEKGKAFVGEQTMSADELATYGLN